MRKKRKNGGLWRRCLCCNKNRKFREPERGHGGEYHPRRPPWIVTPFGLACGFCYIRYGGKVSLSPRETLRQRVMEAAKKDQLVIAGR